MQVENEDLKKRVAYLTAQLAALDHSFPVPYEDHAWLYNNRWLYNNGWLYNNR
jgi:hypothetical protein